MFGAPQNPRTARIGPALTVGLALGLTLAATPAAAGVGGSTTGLDNRNGICRNVTTGQVVTFPLSGASWDCEAQGLVVAPGDVVATGARGTVTGEATCSHPVEESGIGQPGETGWPFHLANLITIDQDGEITQLGVDRWDRAGLVWDVFLWDTSCSLLATVSVTDGTGWFFGDIAPVAVSAGEQYYVGYEVSDAAGSYLYRDTATPVDVGAYTVEQANFADVGFCPQDLNGFLVTPVDVEICTQGAGPQQEPACHRGGESLGGTRVRSDEVLFGPPFTD